jgi:hypothetical protein
MSKIKRGRTGSDLPPAMQGTEKGLSSGSREDVAHSSGRPERVSMGNMKKLDVPSSLMEEGYYYYWFEDRDGRIPQARAAYYEHVVDEQGNNYSRGSGGNTLYLMRLRQEYRNEDNALKKKRVADTMEKEAFIGQGEYAPDRKTGRSEGGTSAVAHDNLEQ